MYYVSALAVNPWVALLGPAALEGASGLGPGTSASGAGRRAVSRGALLLLLLLLLLRTNY